MPSILCVLQGGLGNQLFILHSVMSIAFATGSSCVFLENIPRNSVTIRQPYWTTLFEPLRKLVVNEEQFSSLCERAICLNEPAEYSDSFFDKVNEIVKVQGKSVLLRGYFQDIRYLGSLSVRSYISQKIGFPTMQHLFPCSKDVALHFRYGDYLQLRSVYTILGANYYISALRYFLQQDPLLKTVQCFCEEADSALVVNLITHHLIKLFPLLTFTIVEFSIPDWQQLFQISNCKHIAIANSTYSWWAAFIATNSRSKQSPHQVCYPSDWYVDTTKVPPNVPDSWKQIMLF